MTQLDRLCRRVTACRRCPRLVAHREEVARVKRRAYRECSYWGKPLPGFGDPRARLLVVGLAPAAHGGNRTGRIFTGDRSGDWLFAALHRFGFANQPISVSRGDGLRLADAYVTAAARCAPPQNKPAPEELRNCRPFLAREWQLLPRVRVVVALGRVAFDAVLGVLGAADGSAPRPRPLFAHARRYQLARVTLLGSYHPSQRNTQTGLLTRAMFEQVFSTARVLLGQAPP